MTMPPFPTRAQIEASEPLEFTIPARHEREYQITIELAPDGLHITAAYDGTLASIPAAVERLRQFGLLELVSPAKITTPTRKAHRERVEPLWRPDGTPMCPAHHKPLLEGQRGLYCPARAKPGEEQNAAGRCSLVFADY